MAERRRSLTLAYAGAGDDFTPLLLSFGYFGNWHDRLKRQFLKAVGTVVGTQISDVLDRVKLVHYIDICPFSERLGNSPRECLEAWIGYMKYRLVGSKWYLPRYEATIWNNTNSRVLEVSDGNGKTFKYWYSNDVFDLAPDCRDETKSVDVLWATGNVFSIVSEKFPFTDAKYVIMNPEDEKAGEYLSALHAKFPKAELLGCHYRPISDTCKLCRRIRYDPIADPAPLLEDPMPPI